MSNQCDNSQLFSEYCATRAVPDLARSEYLEILGEQLHKNIGILWTGRVTVCDST